MGSPLFDQHVHTQFSWDASRGDMEASCRRAESIGLRAIAFTEHADFVSGVHEEMHRLDVDAYLIEVERCRTLFPSLRIVSGAELGEPHRFPAEVQALLRGARLERILGSVHCLTWSGRLIDASQLGRLPAAEAGEFMRAYLREVAALARSDQPFQVLSHIDYPKRYWPVEAVRFDEDDYEGEYREVLSALAQRGGVLELNTSRGMPPERGWCPGPKVVGWWRELGGDAVSFGSDAHAPDMIAKGFAAASAMAEGLGFKPSADLSEYWRR
ncbi:MAG TPA: histidinol-phosphatase HisJ family protein [Candidatus Acidoferrales bacterium]|nr:histidinol-phosphatase HisJ family protein [Candidatus Acidoferrales bacterium]